MDVRVLNALRGGCEGEMSVGRVSGCGCGSECGVRMPVLKGACLHGEEVQTCLVLHHDCV